MFSPVRLGGIACPLASVFCVLFLWMSCCICYANAKKPHVTMATISWAARQGAAVSPCRDLWTLRCWVPVHVYLYVRVNVYVWERKRGEGWSPSRPFLLHHHNMTINPAAFCIDGSRRSFGSMVCRHWSSGLHRPHTAACHCLHSPYVVTDSWTAFLSHYNLCPLLLERDWWPRGPEISRSHIAM